MLVFDGVLKIPLSAHIYILILNVRSATSMFLEQCGLLRCFNHTHSTSRRWIHDPMIYLRYICYTDTYRMRLPGKNKCARSHLYVHAFWFTLRATRRLGFKVNRRITKRTQKGPCNEYTRTYFSTNLTVRTITSYRPTDTYNNVGIGLTEITIDLCAIETVNRIWP